MKLMTQTERSRYTTTMIATFATCIVDDIGRAFKVVPWFEGDVFTYDLITLGTRCVFVTEEMRNYLSNKKSRELMFERVTRSLKLRGWDLEYSSRGGQKPISWQFRITPEDSGK